MKQLGKLLVLSGACLLGSGVILAQALPGPLTPPPADATSASAPPPAAPKKPEVQPRKSILGAWKFNKDESDDGRAKLKQSREAENTNRGNGGYGGGPRMGGGWPGGPLGGGRGGQGYPESRGDISDSMGDIVNPPREMKMSQNFDKDPQVLLSDDREHRIAFLTDGRKLQKEKNPGYQEIAAHWDGNKLVTDEKGAHGGKLSRTFELSSDGKQLIETVHLSDSKGNHPVNVQYVYDATDEAVGGYNVR